MIRQLGNCCEIFEMINDGVIIIDAGTGAIVGANSLGCELLGYDRRELLNLDVADISEAVPSHAAAEALRWLRKAAAGEPQVFEWCFRRHAGTLFRGEVSLKKARVEGKQRVVAVIRDLTGRKNLTPALQCER